MKMPSKISRCIICGQFFDSKKQLRDHKDKQHRITNSKMTSLRFKIDTANNNLLLSNK